MSQQLINIGGAPNDGTGDSIRTSFTKANENFTELYSKIRTTVPTSAIGSTGDVAGIIAFDSEFIYVCVADWDGSSAIWSRTAVETWV